MIGFQAHLTAVGRVGDVAGIALHGVKNAIFISHYNTHMVDLVTIALGFEVDDVSGLGDIDTVCDLLAGVDIAVGLKPIQTIYRIGMTIYGVTGNVCLVSTPGEEGSTPHCFFKPTGLLLLIVVP